ncbi:MAG: hypothetical protein K9N47_04150 [Prosthecobacter sp.]|nr:hypothetical protein [Prosthecobacter sp.]
MSILIMAAVTGTADPPIIVLRTAVTDTAAATVRLPTAAAMDTAVITVDPVVTMVDTAAGAMEAIAVAITVKTAPGAVLITPA